MRTNRTLQPIEIPNPFHSQAAELVWEYVEENFGDEADEDTELVDLSSLSPCAPTDSDLLGGYGGAA